MKFKSLWACCAVICAGLAQAEVTVSECIIQEVLPEKNMTGAFMKFENNGKETVNLISASAEEITKNVELHEMVMQEGVMKMSAIKEYAITPGEHAFKKGGYHVMLLDIENVPEVGKTYPITLNFEGGNTLNCDAKVYSVDEVMKYFAVEDAAAEEDATATEDEATEEHEHKHEHEHKAAETTEEAVG